MSYGKSPAASGSWAIDKLLGGALGYTWIICIHIYIYIIKLRSYIYQQPQPHPQVVTTLDSQTMCILPQFGTPTSGPQRLKKTIKTKHREARPGTQIQVSPRNSLLLQNGLYNFN